MRALGMTATWIAAGLVVVGWWSAVRGDFPDTDLVEVSAIDTADAAAAEPADLGSLDARIRALESRADIPAPTAPGRSAGWSGGADVMFFRPCATARTLPVQYVDEAGYQPAWRLWGGYSGADGLGIDVRWWQYDQTVRIGSFSPGAELTFQKLDLVARQRLGFRTWDMLLFAGPTYAANGMGYVGPDVPASNNRRWRFDGAGLTAGIAVVRRTPWLAGLSLAASTQGSAVFGPSVMPGSFYDPGPYRQETTCATIFELSFGPRWERRLRGGAIAFVGGACEAQFWSAGLGSESSQFSPTVGSWSGDIGLIGFTCTTGIRR